MFRICIDRGAIEAQERRARKLVREALIEALGGKKTRQHFGIIEDKGWTTLPPNRDIVLLVHGLDSSPESLAGILEDVRKLGLQAAVFHYPGDQPITDSAALLSKELKAMARKQPEHAVSIVAFSMGGLVARAAIEDPDLDPGNVHRLIMAGTPTHGSLLAALEIALKIWVESQKERQGTCRLLAAIEDGFGEAGEDLMPGSIFLTQLNRRDRNPRLKYTLLLGAGAPLSGLAPATLLASLECASRHNRLVQFFGKPARDWLGDLGEVVRGKGDGAVALKRGRLEGVEDTVVLGFDHLDMLADSDHPAVRELRSAILDRLSLPALE